MSNISASGNEDLIIALNELANNLHWSWSHATDEIWKNLDPLLWELTHNPLVVLQTVSRDKINKVLEDATIRQSIEEFIQNRRLASSSPTWFRQCYPESDLSNIAFFSMEYMLSEALPIYSGGLGNVAGDHLKSASDLGVPVIGIGLLYQQGYSRQVIHKDGTQQNFFPYNDPGQLPVKPLRQANGEWLRVEIKLPGYSVWLRSWKVEVGNVSLFLLDSNDTANFPAHRGITSELYGAGAELRLMQELVLGIGGWQLLKAIGIKPEICHLNEGHSAFVVLARALEFMEENNQSFEVALAATRAGNIFTTHTAVGAGFDCFSPVLMEQYLGRYVVERLKISFVDFLSLGRQDPGNGEVCFNVSYLAIRGSGRINGVSKLHGKVSRRLFSPLFPRLPEVEVPIEYVTNGIHTPTWDSREADELWTEACGKDRWLGTLGNLEQNIKLIRPEKLWKLRTNARKTFIDYIRKRYYRQLAMSGIPMQAVEAAKHLFNPEVLTLGFARRFVTYKRPNLLLHDPERLSRILTNSQMPVQLVLAGKAHPGDWAGQNMIKEWIQFIDSHDLNNHIIFLSDYDMLLTEHMVQGIDVWINTPQRPWEACGTSGMKVLVNGGLNVSVLDGWWDEAYSAEVGWALTDDGGSGNNVDINAAQAEQLYNLLETEIVPQFYSRDEANIPISWVNRMRESMAVLTPRFSANRSVRQYTEEYYIPAAKKYRERTAAKGEETIQAVNWKNDFLKKWAQLNFGEMNVSSNNDLYNFSTRVFLHDIHVDEIKVELFANGINGGDPEKYEMKYVEGSTDENGASMFNVSIPPVRAISDYTPRIVPRTSHLVVPLELSCILWQQ